MEQFCRGLPAAPSFATGLHRARFLSFAQYRRLTAGHWLPLGVPQASSRSKAACGFRQKAAKTPSKTTSPSTNREPPSTSTTGLVEVGSVGPGARTSEAPNGERLLWQPKTADTKFTPLQEPTHLETFFSTHAVRPEITVSTCCQTSARDLVLSLPACGRHIRANQQLGQERVHHGR